MKKKLTLFFLLYVGISSAQKMEKSTVGLGWASNSINTTIFRKNSIISGSKYQFTSYYDNDGFVCVARRSLGNNDWSIKKTSFVGNIKDAHNSISIMVDGEGYLHLSWDHHNNALNYAKSKQPFEIDQFEKSAMIGSSEGSVTYPEFYRKSNGNILFLYRDGGSGRGNLVLNEYILADKNWIRIHDNLIDGEGKRNAYPQFCLDRHDHMHLSWVWRNTPDVATNHNLCYAMSKDGGKTWEKSSGATYQLPIDYLQSDIIHIIPESSDLMNQTSMTTDDDGKVYIANYWRDTTSNLPQYHVVFQDKKKWQTRVLNFRQNDFRLAGGGTKKIPISRPQILVSGGGKKAKVYLLFRDEDLGSKASVAIIPNAGKSAYRIVSLTNRSLGDWEPSYDTERWKHRKVLSLFTQEVTQKDGEGLQQTAPTAIEIVDVRF
ncbi:neuraminidase [Sphingobacterium olei]|uniref:Neuraminidase n=1 Tax=Sphingobacterium olei TaxID=2571155 RepID=A0A4U0NYP5_9SPHI|nr:BNR repeat-containing protein [Sphingobacterium olei]TJZ59830.1 neuraminidase [Sphingobacterium olei]